MEPGQVLGDRYRLLVPLGQGGTSVVWQARDDVLGREVAVKLLATRLAHDPALTARLRIEARAAARLHHPHAVTVYDFGEASRPDGPPVPYVVLELVEGRSLSEVLLAGPLPWREAVRVCAQVAAALAAAHAHGIAHRDVKPGNVMLTPDGAKLVDFGISATIGEADLGPDGQLLGTPAYLAPERLESGPVRGACDVYGLGLLLYKSLAGRLPWQEEELTALLVAHRQDAPDPLPSLPGLPAEVVDLCHRCLSRRPADRPSSDEAAAVLAAVDIPAAAAREAEVLTLARSAELSPTVVEHPARRRRLFALIATGAALAAGVAGAGAIVRDGAPPGSAPGSAPAAIACQVRYEVREDSGSEFAADVTLTNTGAAPVTAWRLDFAFPADQRVVSTSADGWEQYGRAVAVAGTGEDATLPAGGSVTLALEGSYRGVNPLPTTFRVNGSGCTPTLTAVSVSDALPAEERSDRPAPSPAPETEPETEPEDNPGRGNGNGNGNPGKGRRS